MITEQNNKNDCIKHNRTYNFLIVNKSMHGLNRMIVRLWCGCSCCKAIQGIIAATTPAQQQLLLKAMDQLLQSLDPLLLQEDYLWRG